MCHVCGRAYEFGEEFKLAPLDVEALEEPLRRVVRRMQSLFVADSPS